MMYSYILTHPPLYIEYVDCCGQIDAKYSELYKWKHRALAAVHYFDSTANATTLNNAAASSGGAAAATETDCLLSLRDVLFNAVVDIDPMKTVAIQVIRTQVRP